MEITEGKGGPHSLRGSRVTVWKKAGAAAPAFLLAARSGSEVKLQSELQLSCPLRARGSAKVGVARQWPCVGSAASGIK